MSPDKNVESVRQKMLERAQVGELTVSRGIEILDMWHAGNWSDDMLPPVRQDLIELDFMPVEIIDRLKQQRDKLLEAITAMLNSAAPEWETESGIAEYADACSKARAAIASAKGGA